MLNAPSSAWSLYATLPQLANLPPPLSSPPHAASAQPAAASSRASGTRRREGTAGSVPGPPVGADALTIKFAACPPRRRSARDGARVRRFAQTAPTVHGQVPAAPLRQLGDPRRDRGVARVLPRGRRPEPAR